MVTRFLFQCRASKKQLQQLVGKLSWACRVVYGGQTFLRRILDMLNLFQSPSAKVPLSAEFHEDIRCWHCFLHYFNGKCNFLCQSPTTDVQTDVCLVAAGAYIFEGVGCTTTLLSIHQTWHFSILTIKKSWLRFLQFLDGLLVGPINM